MKLISSEQKHSHEIFLYSLSRAFERASYYGIRSILVLYMVRNQNLYEKDASSLYAGFIWLVLFTQILGGVIGDLLLGSKRSILTGGIIQTIGVFLLCIPSTPFLYAGMLLIAIGSGLFGPNMLASIGKLYLSRTSLLDSAFTIFYTSINLGAFLGTFLIAYIGEIHFSYGFILGGVFMIISTVLTLFIKTNIDNMKPESPINIDKSILKILGVIFIIGIFWTVYEFSGYANINFEILLEQSPNAPRMIGPYFSAAFVLPLGIIASIVWSFFYLNEYIKITIGFLLMILSMILLLVAPHEATQTLIWILILHFFLESTSEIFVAPLLHTVLTKYSNPKYLAIISAAALVPPKLFSWMSGFIFKLKPTDTILLISGIGLSVIVILILVIYLAISSKKTE